MAVGEGPSPGRAEAYVKGVSTRRVDDLVRAMRNVPELVRVFSQPVDPDAVLLFAGDPLAEPGSLGISGRPSYRP